MKTTNEETIYEQKNGLVNEETLAENVGKNEETPQEEPKEKRNRRWVEAGIGAGTGVAAGIIGTLFTSGTIPAAEAETEGNEEGSGVIDDGLTTPVVTDGQLSIAHGVNDNMSFGEAFRTAHDEVGPGGVFEWHGQLYGTYTAAEWNSLSSEEKLEYNNHLRVVGTPDYASNVSHHESQEQHVEAHTEDVAVDVTETHDGGQQEVEVVGHAETASMTDDVEVQVLGVEYVQSEDGQEMALGGMSVDGQEVYVLDADNDGLGDVGFVDLDGDGKVDDNEVIDLSDTPVEMSAFENNSQEICDGIDPAEPDYLPMENV